jgi:hypothetical protein
MWTFVTTHLEITNAIVLAENNLCDVIMEAEKTVINGSCSSNKKVQLLCVHVPLTY